MDNFKQEGRSSRYTYRTSPEGDHTKIELYYDKGGLNYGTYKTDTRGIWATIGAAYREVGEHFVTERFGVFDGKSVRVFLVPLKRGNPAALKRVAEAMDKDAPAIAALWLTDRDAAIADLRNSTGLPVTTVPGSVNTWPCQDRAQQERAQ